MSAIQINKKPNHRVIEFGCGANRHEAADVAVDARPLPGVDFLVDLGRPFDAEHNQAISSDEFDVALCRYALEHLPYAAVPGFLAETLRVLKPGGLALFITANTEAQLEWVRQNPDGWDGKTPFAAASEVLFGSQDYDENTHKCYFSPAILQSLFIAAGFTQVQTAPWGERKTDIVVQGVKPAAPALGKKLSEGRPGSWSEDLLAKAKYAPETMTAEEREKLVAKSGQGSPIVQQSGAGLPPAPAPEPPPPSVHDQYTAGQLYDRAYWNGGGKVGGYAREGYWDFPVHEVTAQHILLRRPESVLELGAARGYVGKRLEDYGVRYLGLEVSKHCYMTRVCENVWQRDLLDTPWPITNKEYHGWTSTDGGRINTPVNTTEPSHDLAFSIAVFEHIPEAKLPDVLSELKRLTRRGLHGIDFGAHDDGFDKTHCTLRPQGWWREQFDRAGLQAHEIVDKEELERGDLYPAGYFTGDGKVKLNVGSFTTMFHRGWTNIDVHDLGAFAQAHRYQYLRHDVRNGLPYATGAVDLIACCHMLEHLSYDEGLRFLRECRRVLKPGGAMRIQVPDAGLLCSDYVLFELGTADGTPRSLADFDEISPTCESRPTLCGKLWELLFAGHQCMYDGETLAGQLKAAGFLPVPSLFRAGYDVADGTAAEAFRQIRRETLDTLPGLTLFMNALPLVG